MQFPDDFINKIIVGDCIDVMKQLPDGSVDLVVTSPPYNLRNTVGGGLYSHGGKWKDAAIQNGYDGYTDDIPHEQYVEWQRNCLTQMLRVLKDDGAIFYNHKWRTQNGLLQDRNDIVSGFPVRQIIIWNRGSGMNFNGSFFVPTYEVIYLIAKRAFKLADGACAMGDIWKFPFETKNDHPAPFPFELPKRCISSTNAKIVLDPFSGSGTTALAAKMLGRNYIGIEQSPKYAADSVKRLESAVSNDLFTLFGT